MESMLCLTPLPLPLTGLWGKPENLDYLQMTVEARAQLKSEGSASGGAHGPPLRVRTLNSTVNHMHTLDGIDMCG